jgi:SAM-dependent methyltransferase
LIWRVARAVRACGFAKETGAQLVGRDLSSVAIERATERLAGLGMEERAEFAQGSFEQTGLASASADAVMTVDALQYAPSKRRALAGVARVLRPGGRFGLVAFELDEGRVGGLDFWDDPIGDYRPLLEQAGFEIVSYEQTPNWEEQVAAGFGAIVAERETLQSRTWPRRYRGNGAGSFCHARNCGPTSATSLHTRRASDVGFVGASSNPVSAPGRI